MKHAFRSAAAALAASLVLASSALAIPSALPAPAPETQAPAVLFQLAIRGFDDVFAAVDRFAPDTSPQLKAMITGMGSGAIGVDPLSLLDTAAPATARLVAFSVPGQDMPGAVLDFPAAGADPAAALDRLAAAAAFVPVDLSDSAAAAMFLPAGTRMFRPASAPAESEDARFLFIPHGGNFAVLCMGFLGGTTPEQAWRLFSSTPVPPVEGTLALSSDFDALLPLLPEGDGPEGLAKTFIGDIPLSSIAYGLAIDAADRLRLDLSMAPRAGNPIATVLSFTGPANPLANAILFPDALAAETGRTTSAACLEAMMDWQIALQEKMAAALAKIDPENAQTFSPDAAKAVYAAEVDVLRLLGEEIGLAFLPAADGAAAPWAMLGFPEDPAAALDAFPARLDALLSAVLKTVSENQDDLSDEAKKDLADAHPRFEAGEERTVLDIPVRSVVLRFEDTDADPVRTIDLFSFDVAAAGPALYLGSLPDAALSEVLADLAAGATSRGPVASMPAFVAAYGLAPADISAGYVRLSPLFRTLAAAVRGRLQTLVETYGDDEDDPADFSDLDEFLALLDDVPDVTIAATHRWDAGLNRFSTTCSLPVSDLLAAIDFVKNRIGPGLFDFSGTDEDEEDEDLPALPEDWDSEDTPPVYIDFDAEEAPAP